MNEIDRIFAKITFKDLRIAFAGAEIEINDNQAVFKCLPSLKSEADYWMYDGEEYDGQFDNRLVSSFMAIGRDKISVVLA